VLYKTVVLPRPSPSICIWTTDDTVDWTILNVVPFNLLNIEYQLFGVMEVVGDATMSVVLVAISYAVTDTRPMEHVALLVGTHLKP
jgi:hypothetical protein